MFSVLSRLPFVVLVPFLLLLRSATAVYLNASADYQSGALGASPHQSYNSSSLTPVELNFDVFYPSTPPLGYLFFAPRGTAVKQPGGLIIDAYGELVWSAEVYGQTMAFSVQAYQGEPVIAIWTGAFNANGYGNGYSLLLDQTYTQIANITTTLANQSNDFHEFQVTNNNTALITVYVVKQYDLSSYNVTTADGTTGWIIEGYAQEIDIASGEALFTWGSLDHVSPSLSYASPGSTGVSESEPWDYFHINSIDMDSKGNYLISSRHCHAVYYVSGETGDILWTLNGMNSSFSQGTGSTFEWQHDARWENDETQISLFDNAATDWTSDEATARGLLLDIDTANMTVTLADAYIPWNATVTESQGSVQLQSSGEVLVGWGQNPFFGEYDANGTLLWTAQFGVGDVESYRCLRANWTGYPATAPAVSVNGSTVYVSWNGATEVSVWNLLGTTNTSIVGTSLLNVTRAGFETALVIPAGIQYTYLQAQAVAANGTQLGVSDYISLNGSTTTPAASTTAPIAAVTTSVTASSSASAVATSTAKSAGHRYLPGCNAVLALVALVALGL